ncbi:MAG: diguanylate cyclase, partial [Oscillospiraceae bacterium]
PYYKDAMSGNAAVGLKYTADGENILEIIYAVPIYQGDAINGVLVGSELRSDVNEYIMTDSFGGLGASFITDGEGNIILSSANGGEMVGNSPNYLEYLAGAGGADGLFAQSEDAASVHRVSIGGADYIIIQNAVDFNGWNHILQVDALFVNSQSSRISNSVLILLLVVLVSVCVVIAVLFRLQVWANRLKTKAERDLLTNLLNKKTFESDVESMLSDHSADEIGALLIIDLDNFKAINDTLGHIVGDKVLSGVADKIRETFRKQDRLGRIGGDEFAVYMTFGSVSGEYERYVIIRSRAEQLCGKIRELTDKLDGGISVSCSIGIALEPEHGASYEQLYKCADEALYLSKNSGKNRFSFFTDKSVSDGEGGTRE